MEGGEVGSLSGLGVVVLKVESSVDVELSVEGCLNGELGVKHGETRLEVGNRRSALRF